MEGQRLLFRQLDGKVRFHRDTALGRIFHPGTVSYREVTTNDSLHITVSAENRVSVHFDRLSPLAIRPGRPCRYSLLRVIAHNVAHVAEAVARLGGHHPAQRRCELDCEAVALEATSPRVYEFSCKAAGAEGCRWSTRATSEEELVAKVAEHARRVHRVRNVSDTIASYALDVARSNGASA